MSSYAKHCTVYEHTKSKFHPSQFFGSANRAAPISFSLAIGQHTAQGMLRFGGWPSGSTVCFTPMLFPKVLNAKRGKSMYHIFSSLWYDSTGNRAPTYKPSILPLTGLKLRMIDLEETLNAVQLISPSFRPLNQGRRALNQGGACLDAVRTVGYTSSE